MKRPITMNFKPPYSIEVVTVDRVFPLRGITCFTHFTGGMYCVSEWSTGGRIQVDSLNHPHAIFEAGKKLDAHSHNEVLAVLANQYFLLADSGIVIHPYLTLL